MTGIGTIANVAAIIIGCVLGWSFRRRIPGHWHQTLLQVLGVFTCLLGTQMFFTASQIGTPILVPLVATLIGVMIGESLQLEQRLYALGHWLEADLSRRGWLEERVAQAFVTSSNLFAIGPIAIIGSLQDGLDRNPTLLFVKAAMDGVVSIAFTASLGLGTIFSCGPVLLYQGSITLLADKIQPWVTPPLLGVINSVGSLMLVSIGLNLLSLTKIPVTNLLPALAIGPILVYILPVSQP
ncbi:MAG: DUF554 domain-containing protein [Aphanocapsa sp. GSE-SYN-MK-11-07L]|jgi:hypothetical protein|nr:DUF554 domain-containing protein [Aphanocapsa sp. GSE-SYN-MK-11-07L]